MVRVDRNVNNKRRTRNKKKNYGTDNSIDQVISDQQPPKTNIDNGQGSSHGKYTTQKNMVQPNK